MKVQCKVFAVTLVMIFCVCACAEEISMQETYAVKDGSKEATFSYPQGCTIEDEGPPLGVIIRLDTENYIAVSIPRKNKTGTQKLLENIGDEQKIIQLSDGVHVFASHGESNHPMLSHLDIIEVGIDLGKNMGIIVNITCPYGQTEIYEAAMMIVESLTEDTVFSEWMTETWIPYIQQQ